METTLYWLTRLDSIRHVAEAFIILSGICWLPFFLCMIINKGVLAGVSPDNPSFDEERWWLKFGKKASIISLIVFMLSILVNCFVPTTKQGLLLYGVKESKEFIEKNPTAKQLPEKAIKALDLYLEKEMAENSKSVKPTTANDRH
jgi:hypothetical protein